MGQEIKQGMVGMALLCSMGSGASAVGTMMAGARRAVGRLSSLTLARTGSLSPPLYGSLGFLPAWWPCITGLLMWQLSLPRDRDRSCQSAQKEPFWVFSTLGRRPRSTQIHREGTETLPLEECNVKEFKAISNMPEPHFGKKTFSY